MLTWLKNAAVKFGWIVLFILTLGGAYYFWKKSRRAELKNEVLTGQADRTTKLRNDVEFIDDEIEALEAGRDAEEGRLLGELDRTTDELDHEVRTTGSTADEANRRINAGRLRGLVLLLALAPVAAPPSARAEPCTRVMSVMSGHVVPCDGDLYPVVTAQDLLDAQSERDTLLKLRAEDYEAWEKKEAKWEARADRFEKAYFAEQAAHRATVDKVDPPPWGWVVSGAFVGGVVFTIVTALVIQEIK